VSQPAMSAALHRLRDYFGDPLLIRVGREMELSPRGQSLVEPVREALLLIQATLGTQPTFTAATTQREFTLIMSEEAVPDLLPFIGLSLRNIRCTAFCMLFAPIAPKHMAFTSAAMKKKFHPAARILRSTAKPSSASTTPQLAE